jgi:hypothetical protein
MKAGNEACDGDSSVNETKVHGARLERTYTVERGKVR